MFAYSAFRSFHPLSYIYMKQLICWDFEMLNSVQSSWEHKRFSAFLLNNTKKIEANWAHEIEVNGFLIPPVEPTSIDENRMALIMIYGILISSALFYTWVQYFNCFNSHISTLIFAMHLIWSNAFRPWKKTNSWLVRTAAAAATAHENDTLS